jgi:hypothetical protein
MPPTQHIHALFLRNLDLVRAEWPVESDEAHHRRAMIVTEQQYSAIKAHEENRKKAA